MINTKSIFALGKAKCLIIVVLLITFGISNVYAQWDAQVSQYWRVKTYFNPSFVAAHDTIQASILHRQQWVGIENAPKSFIVTGDMPIKFLDRKHGVGIMVMTESIGLFKNIVVVGQYAYKKKWKNNIINLGIQLGAANMSFDAGKISIPQDQKEDLDIPTTSSSSTKFDGGIGLSWINPKFYFGVSVTHLTKPSFDIGDKLTTYINRVYYFTGGYNLKIKNSKYELQPSFLVKTDAIVTQYEVTGRVVYNKMFNGGMSWRKDDGFIFLLGANVLGFEAGYAFDLSTSEIGKASNGTHEFFLRYTIPLKQKKGTSKHKSIRLL